MIPHPPTSTLFPYTTLFRSPVTDGRVRGTIEAIERELMQDGFVLRYRPQEEKVDGLPGREGVFLPCSFWRSEEHTSELQSHSDLVCRLLLEKKKKKAKINND